MNVPQKKRNSSADLVKFNFYDTVLVQDKSFIYFIGRQMCVFLTVPSNICCMIRFYVISCEQFLLSYTCFISRLQCTFTPSGGTVSPSCLYVYLSFGGDDRNCEILSF